MNMIHCQGDIEIGAAQEEGGCSSCGSRDCGTWPHAGTAVWAASPRNSARGAGGVLKTRLENWRLDCLVALPHRRGCIDDRADGLAARCGRFGRLPASFPHSGRDPIRRRHRRSQPRRSW